MQRSNVPIYLPAHVNDTLLGFGDTYIYVVLIWHVQFYLRTLRSFASTLIAPTSSLPASSSTTLKDSRAVTFIELSQ